MKRLILFRNFLIIILCVSLLVPLTNSCKKGEEDPWFSFYSRKHRLCQDWKFSFYKRVEQYNDSIISYQYDGSSFIKVMSNKSYISSAIMKISFNKTGTYVWDEYITTDTSTYSYVEEGNWYFTGGTKESNSKEKELLALQKTKVTQTFSDNITINTTTYSGSGDLETNVFRIIKLASDEVKLKSEVKETQVNVNPALNGLMIIITEINLKKNV